MTVRTKYGRRKFDNGNIRQGEDRGQGGIKETQWERNRREMGGAVRLIDR